MITRKEREDRPIIASMSDLAASGGYYVALPAHAIVAQPSTLTGSIGIFGGKFTTGGLYEKLGARVDSVSNGKNAEINSPLRPYNAEERKKVQEQLQAFYDQFVEKVAESRQEHAGEDRSACARTGVDRPSGEGERPGGRARRPGAAPSHSPKSGRRSRRPAKWRWSCTRRPRSFYRTARRAVVRDRAQTAFGVMLSANLSEGEVEVLRAIRGPLSIVSARRAAGADAVYVPCG